MLQAAVRQRVMLRLVFLRADQAWAATAARIDGCRHPPVLLCVPRISAHHRDDAKGKRRDGAEKHEHVEISAGVGVIEGSDGDLFLSFSCLVACTDRCPVQAPVPVHWYNRCSDTRCSPACVCAATHCILPTHVAVSVNRRAAHGRCRGYQRHQRHARRICGE